MEFQVGLDKFGFVTRSVFQHPCPGPTAADMQAAVLAKDVSNLSCGRREMFTSTKKAQCRT